MLNLQSDQRIKNLNYYKILFHKHSTLPVGHFSRNLINQIKDNKNQKSALIDKNSEYFNPISNNNIFKIQKIYSIFRRNKSAMRFHGDSSKKSIKKIISRPMSQKSTLIDYSKNSNRKLNEKLYLGQKSNMRSSETTLFLNKYNNESISKIEKISNIKKNYLTDLKHQNINKNLFKKKDLIQKPKNKRSSSAELIYKIRDQTKESNISNLIKHETKQKEQKKQLKGRLLSAVSRHLVINKETFKYYNILYKNNTEEKNNNSEINPKKKYSKNFHFSKHNPDIFSKINPPLRYEDYYYSPLELLEKYFTKDEIILLKSSPGYFGLNKFPFKNSDFEITSTLLSKLDSEENQDTTFETNKMIKNRKKQKIKFNYDKEKEKIKKLFQEKKIKKSKREPIKGKDFISHYERDIEPDEGTVEYYERKYIKYLYNKEKKMEKKINNLKFKKSRFEYLKNLRTKKLQEEKNVQRITSPIINIIKKNYLRLNSSLSA